MTWLRKVVLGLGAVTPIGVGAAAVWAWPEYDVNTQPPFAEKDLAPLRDMQVDAYETG